MIRAVTIAFLLLATPALAGGVNLNLNDTGVAGLEQMLDIARRNAPTMRDADMAVSIYNALQRAKEASAAAEASALSDAEKSRAEAEDKVNKLQDEIAKMKAAAPKGSEDVK